MKTVGTKPCNRSVLHWHNLVHARRLGCGLDPSVERVSRTLAVCVTAHADCHDRKLYRQRRCLDRDLHRGVDRLLAAVPRAKVGTRTPEHSSVI